MMRKIIALVALAIVPAITACGQDRNSYRDPINVRVMDADSGQPLADAYVLASSFTSKSIWIFYRQPEVSPHALFRTGPDGMIAIPQGISKREYLGLTVWRPGYRYVWLTHIGLANGKTFVIESDPVRYKASAEPASMIKLKSVDAAYPARDRKNDLEHFNNKLKTLEPDPALTPWQRGITVLELRAILSGELDKLK